MDEIPDDVRVALARDYVRKNFESGEPWSMTIARAILAERQRCADVNDDLVSYLKETKTMNRSYAIRAAYNASKAILNP